MQSVFNRPVPITNLFFKKPVAFFQSKKKLPQRCDNYFPKIIFYNHGTVTSTDNHQPITINRHPSTINHQPNLKSALFLLQRQHNRKLRSFTEYSGRRNATAMPRDDFFTKGQAQTCAIINIFRV